MLVQTVQKTLLETRGHDWGRRAEKLCSALNPAKTAKDLQPKSRRRGSVCGKVLKRYWDNRILAKGRLRA